MQNVGTHSEIKQCLLARSGESWNKYKRCLRDVEVLSFERRDHMCLCVLVIYVTRKGTT